MKTLSSNIWLKFDWTTKKKLKVPLFKMYSEKEADGSIYYYNDNHDLHCEFGPAISWPDGDEMYFLNGIEMDDEISWLLKVLFKEVKICSI